MLDTGRSSEMFAAEWTLEGLVLMNSFHVVVEPHFSNEFLVTPVTLEQFFFQVNGGHVIGQILPQSEVLLANFTFERLALIEDN